MLKHPSPSDNKPNATPNLWLALMSLVYTANNTRSVSGTAGTTGTTTRLLPRCRSIGRRTRPCASGGASSIGWRSAPKCLATCPITSQRWRGCNGSRSTTTWWSKVSFVGISSSFRQSQRNDAGQNAFFTHHHHHHHRARLVILH